MKKLFHPRSRSHRVHGWIWQRNHSVKHNILWSPDDVLRAMRKHRSWYNSPFRCVAHACDITTAILVVFHWTCTPCDRQYAKRVRVRGREITRRIYKYLGLYVGTYVHITWAPINKRGDQCHGENPYLGIS